MNWNNVYLLLFLGVVGFSTAYPPNKAPYVVTWTGDDEVKVDEPEHGLLGRKMCTRGPAYWCHNITHAAECHAMQHCITKVWENPKEKLPEDKDSVCEVCLDMVKQARDQLLSNETQDELRQVLEGSCNLIPLKLVAKECRELADDFIPELIDALTSRMDPQMVCHISGLCNSKRIDDMLAQQDQTTAVVIKPLDPENIDTCPECEHYIGEAVESLKKLTKKDLRVQLLNICGYLGSYSESCRQAVIHEMDAIYEYIQSNMKPKELCSLIGLCVESTLHRVPLQAGGRFQQGGETTVRVWQPPKGHHGDDLECDFCKQLTVSVRNWLVANATEEEFQQVIEGLCKQTGKYKGECLNLAEQYGKQLYQVLVQDLNPDQVCQSIGICPSGLKRVQLSKDNTPIWTMIALDDKAKKDTLNSDSSEEDEDSDESIPLMRLIPGERLTGDDEIRPKDKIKVECQFCKLALHSLQEYLEDITTEEEIRDRVNRLCTEYIPEALVEQCKVFVEEYGEGLINLLAQEVDPSEVCPKLRLCPASSNQQLQRAVPVKDILPTCAICTFTIEKIIDLTGKNLTKESIDNAMEAVCRVVPHNERDRCMSFMKNYGDQVAEMIVIYGTSHGVCAALHLCLLQPAPVTPQKIIINAQLPMERYVPQIITQAQAENDDIITRDDSRKCVICEFVITTLDQRLQDNATEEQIKAEVEHICTFLPKTVQDKCEGFVDLYGEEIIQYLSQEMDPADICERLKLCQAEHVVKHAIQSLKMDTCELCQLISSYMRSLVEEEEADQDVEKIARRSCAIIPKSYQQECKALIEDYGSYLISILSEETDNAKACSQIQLCPSKVQVDIVNTIDV